MHLFVYDNLILCLVATADTFGRVGRNVTLFFADACGIALISAVDTKNKKCEYMNVSRGLNRMATSRKRMGSTMTRTRRLQALIVKPIIPLTHDY